MSNLLYKLSPSTNNIGIGTTFINCSGPGEFNSVNAGIATIPNINPNKITGATWEGNIISVNKGGIGAAIQIANKNKVVKVNSNQDGFIFDNAGSNTSDASESSTISTLATNNRIGLGTAGVGININTIGYNLNINDTSPNIGQTIMREGDTIKWKGIYDDGINNLLIGNTEPSTGRFTKIGVGTYSVKSDSVLDVNGNINLSGSIIPNQTESYDLGSAEYKFRHMFVSENSIWIGENNKIDTSTGELKFKTRKTNEVPKFITQKLTDAGNEENRHKDIIQTVIKDYRSIGIGIGTYPAISDIKLYEWQRYSKDYFGVDDLSVIFNSNIDDDWDVDNGINTGIGSYSSITAVNYNSSGLIQTTGIGSFKSINVTGIGTFRDSIKIGSNILTSLVGNNLKIEDKKLKYNNSETINLKNKLSTIESIETTSTTITYIVTIIHKNGSNIYKIDDDEKPVLTLIQGNTYKFDQSNLTNSGHPLLFYLESNKTTQYSSNITTSGTPGSIGAYTEIVITNATPTILYYQCGNHSNMGNVIRIQSKYADKTTKEKIRGAGGVFTDEAATIDGKKTFKKFIKFSGVTNNDVGKALLVNSTSTGLIFSNIQTDFSVNIGTASTNNVNLGKKNILTNLKGNTDIASDLNIQGNLNFNSINKSISKNIYIDGRIVFNNKNEKEGALQFNPDASTSTTNIIWDSRLTKKEDNSIIRHFYTFASDAVDDHEWTTDLKTSDPDNAIIGWHVKNDSTKSVEELLSNKVYDTNSTNDTTISELCYIKMKLAEGDPGKGQIQLSFTGQHRCIPLNNDIYNNINKYKGYIVYSTGKFKTYNYKENKLETNVNAITINDSLPVIDLTNKKKCKTVFGVISDREEKHRTVSAGAFHTVLSNVNDKNRVYINSIGEGAIWIVNTEGNLENGDYIQCSNVSGLGEKQEENYICNHTVAKITCDCNFELNSPNYKCIQFIDYLTGKIYIKALVGCTYHCG